MSPHLVEWYTDIYTHVYGIDSTYTDVLKQFNTYLKQMINGTSFTVFSNILLSIGLVLMLFHFFGDLTEKAAMKQLSMLQIIPLVRLTKIFRQAQESDIVKNAHAINDGVVPSFKNHRDGDYFFMDVADRSQEEIRDAIVEYVCDKLPKFYGIDPSEIQVLAPMKKGHTGVIELNDFIQNRINPPSVKKEVIYFRDRIFREGDRVMYTCNDYDKKVFNGDIGRITSIFTIGEDEDDCGKRCFKVDFDGNEVVFDMKAASDFILAYATTIHKSQGLTFERAIIDARNSFAHGQTYVALSRCKTLEGMVLETPLRREAIISDSIVDNFTRDVEQNKPGSKQLNDMQKAYFYDLLNDLFNFYSLEQAYKRLLRMMDEELYKLYPKLLAEYKELAPHLKEKVVEVSNRFRNQYTRLINENENYAGNEELQQRIHSGAAYFCEALLPVRALFDKTSMPLDNKELRKQLNERLQALDDALWIKESLLDAMRTEKFMVTDYLKRKAKVMLSLEGETASSGSSTKAPKEKKERKERTRSNSGKVKVEVPTDILHPELYRALSEWRTAKTREVNMPAYVIMQQKALMGIVNLLPDTPAALEAIPYFGAKGVEKYGLEILGIVRKYMKENKLERPEIFTFVSGKEDARERKLDAQHNEEKEKKKDSKLVSYEMFCQGMTIEEIAKARDLVTGTIATHLEHYLREDKIKLEQVVTADKIKKVRTYLETHEFMGVVAIKAALGDDVSYADIRFVLATVGR